MELQKLKGENVSSLNKYCIILINSNMDRRITKSSF